MNERIEDMMYYAGITAQGCWDSMDDYDHQAIKKFAELIINRCVCLMEWQKISPKDDGAYNSALSLAQRNIKEHFGIEE
jgi:hypothetical protein